MNVNISLRSLSVRGCKLNYLALQLWFVVNVGKHTFSQGEPIKLQRQQIRFLDLLL